MTDMPAGGEHPAAELSTVPATPAEQRAEELHAQGRLRHGRVGGLTGRRPLPRRVDTVPLSQTLDEQRRAADG